MAAGGKLRVVVVRDGAESTFEFDRRKRPTVLAFAALLGPMILFVTGRAEPITNNRTLVEKLPGLRVEAREWSADERGRYNACFIEQLEAIVADLEERARRDPRNASSIRALQGNLKSTIERERK